MKSCQQLNAMFETVQDANFRNWLNRVDATIEYDARRELGSVKDWRECFEMGMSCDEAISDLQYARDNRAYCS